MQGKSKREKRQGSTEREGEDGEREAREGLNDVESYIVPAGNFILILTQALKVPLILLKKPGHTTTAATVSLRQKTCQKCAVVLVLQPSGFS